MIYDGTHADYNYDIPAFHYARPGYVETISKIPFIHVATNHTMSFTRTCKQQTRKYPGLQPVLFTPKILVHGAQASYIIELISNFCIARGLIHSNIALIWNAPGAQFNVIHSYIRVSKHYILWGKYLGGIKFDLQLMTQK